MALSKEDHGDIKQAYGKALANKVSKVTRDDVIKGMNERRDRRGQTRLSQNTARLRAEGKLHKSSGMAPDSPFRNVTHINGKKIR